MLLAFVLDGLLPLRLNWLQSVVGQRGRKHLRLHFDETVAETRLPLVPVLQNR